MKKVPEVSEILELPAIYAAIETYLKAIQRHPVAEDLILNILTDDFVTGIRGGDTWQGIDGLREYLASRSRLFDQSTEFKALLSLTNLSDTDVEVTTRLDFFIRRWRPPSPTSEEIAGTAFHTWRLRLVNGKLRIASQIIDGYANLNDSARRLLASPVLGESIEE